ncbi:MAG: hypothetical protein ACW99F_17355, partial [Candidatus Hodarchaeales archaeon]
MKQTKINLRWIILLIIGMISLLTIAAVTTTASEPMTVSSVPTTTQECHFHETGLSGLNWAALPNSHIQVVLVVLSILVGLIAIGVFGIFKKFSKRKCIFD